MGAAIRGGTFFVRLSAVPIGTHACVTVEYTGADGKGRRTLFYCRGNWDGTVGMARWGNETWARILCCHNNWEIGYTPDGFNRREGGWNNLGDCVGVRYGLTGFCHQMANRLMNAMDGRPVLDDIMGDSDGSYNFTRFWHGTFGGGWEDYYRECYNLYMELKKGNAAGAGADDTVPAPEPAAPDSVADPSGLGLSGAELVLRRYEALLKKHGLAAGLSGGAVPAAITEYFKKSARNGEQSAALAAVSPDAVMEREDLLVNDVFAVMNDTLGRDGFRTLFAVDFDPAFRMSRL